ncbi:Hsp20/alpha crystallin family protein [Variovorax sp. Root473]|uniref:Hsp20/alpha crystallin family protein n=1 Tax=Variovorax sp. Root473 TaxID=1736541 RepID=UPI0006F458E3|nr:Hsp20/alpha crystallin family protein [Variovorax sp. Root473]KQX87141.1 heat-shock protein Hsp20 [Variovorax sp. Root473]
MYRSFFPRDMLAEMDRLQRDMQQAFDLSPTIRGHGSHGFPALNVGATPQALEIFAFAPGVDPASLEINLERGLMTIAGERKSQLPDAQAKAAVHINERFEGAFRRVLTLPDDADPEAVQARLRDGVLRITVRRRTSAQPRRIAVQ